MFKRQMSLYSDDKKDKMQDMREIISANDSCWSARGGREGWGRDEEEKVRRGKVEIGQSDRQTDNQSVRQTDILYHLFLLPNM